MSYILSIDQGTTGTTVMLVDSQSLKPIDSVNIEFKQYFPQSSWVEHDLDEIYLSIRHCCQKLFQKNQINKNQIVSIGITNQRETTCAYNKKGEPLARAIVWQDRRTQKKCDELSSVYKNSAYQIKCGLPLDPYFSATKMNWLLKNNKAVQESHKKNELCLSTIDSFILYKLTDGASFLTDATNASRTMLMNLESCQWDQELLSFFDIPRTTLPQIRSTIDNFGKTQNLDFLPDNIPINCLIGDQQSALLGQGCVNKGDMKCTYGTGAFLLLNTGESIKYSQNGLLTTIGLKTNQKTHYALEGSTYIAGAAIQWLRDHLFFFKKSQDIEEMIKDITIEEAQEMRDLFFFPFFTGLGTPHWNSNAKAAIIGMTRSTQRKHLALAALEGIALSVNDTIEVFQKDSSSAIESIRVDGGASLNQKLLELQSSISQITIERPKHIETTVLGAAYGAYLGLNHKDPNELKKLLNKAEATWSTQENSNSYIEAKKNTWKNYIEKNYLN